MYRNLLTWTKIKSDKKNGTKTHLKTRPYLNTECLFSDKQIVFGHIIRHHYLTAVQWDSSMTKTH